jgi:hypothetical protein
MRSLMRPSRDIICVAFFDVEAWSRSEAIGPMVVGVGRETRDRSLTRAGGQDSRTEDPMSGCP